MPHPCRALLFFQLLSLAACQAILQPSPLPADTSPEPWTASLNLEPSATLTPSLTNEPTLATSPTLAATLDPSLTPAPSATPLPAALLLDPLAWHTWPVLPIVPQNTRQIYLYGQSLGNDPHAFSVFGDCQSEPDVFMGVYETDPQAFAALPLDLQETVLWFNGSFNHPSPTVRGGTTAGALLWDEWHQNRFGCTQYETPLQCELRLHNPAFVILHVGTHYDARNQGYLRSILDQLIAAGVVPILASKADDREQDEHVNAQYAQLAVEYNLPFWNFWAAVEGLPNRGLYTRPDATYQGDLYLTEEAALIHRLSALQMLDLLRRAVTGP